MRQPVADWIKKLTDEGVAPHVIRRLRPAPDQLDRARAAATAAGLPFHSPRRARRNHRRQGRHWNYASRQGARVPGGCRHGLRRRNHPAPGTNRGQSPTRPHAWRTSTTPNAIYSTSPARGLAITSATSVAPASEFLGDLKDPNRGRITSPLWPCHAPDVNGAVAN